MEKSNIYANDKEVSKRIESVDNCINLIKNIKGDIYDSPKDSEQLVRCLYMEASKDCSVIEYIGLRVHNMAYVMIAQEKRSTLNKII